MKHYLFVLGILALVACSQNGDGPLSAWNSANTYTGHGYYLEGSLDSGRRVHAMADSLPVQLGSLWIFSTCALQNIQPMQSPRDSIQVDLYFELPLLANGSVTCPVNNPGLDTATRVAPSTVWNNRDMLYLWGAAESLVVYSDTVANTSWTVPASAYTAVALDSIRLRYGSNVDTNFSFLFDSTFANPHLLPLVVGQGPWVVRMLRNMTPDSSYWHYQIQQCSRVRSSCATVSDTIWPTTFTVGDTLLVPVRLRCENDSTHTEYCAPSNWLVDSSEVGGRGSRPDTTWTTGTYYVEKIPSCATVNREQINTYKSLSTGGAVDFWREIFLPSASETRCGIPWFRLAEDGTLLRMDVAGTSLQYWYAFDLDAKRVVLDTALIDSLRQLP